MGSKLERRTPQWEDRPESRQRRVGWLAAARGLVGTAVVFDPSKPLQNGRGFPVEEIKSFKRRHHSEDPHSDSALFRRIRAWLQSADNAAKLPKEWRPSVNEMLKNLKSKQLILMFAPVDRDLRDRQRSSFYLGDHGKMIVELYAQCGLRSAHESRGISDNDLAALAMDAAQLYYSSVYRFRAIRQNEFWPNPPHP